MSSDIRKTIDNIKLAINKKEYNKALVMAQEFVEPGSPMTPRRQLRLACEELESDARELLMAIQDEEGKEITDGLLTNIEYNTSLIKNLLMEIRKPQPQQV